MFTVPWNITNIKRTHISSLPFNFTSILSHSTHCYIIHYVCVSVFFKIVFVIVAVESWILPKSAHFKHLHCSINCMMTRLLRSLTLCHHHFYILKFIWFVWMSFLMQVPCKFWYEMICEQYQHFSHMDWLWII